MRFYSVDESLMEAIAITECSSMMARQIEDELMQVIDNLWCIDEDEVMANYEEKSKISNLHSKKDTYEIVKRYGNKVVLSASATEDTEEDEDGTLAGGTEDSVYSTEPELEVDGEMLDDFNFTIDFGSGEGL